ncbi:hypothetical protein PYCC9005_003236 [Savitreella phatthalungensis]
MLLSYPIVLIIGGVLAGGSSSSWILTTARHPTPVEELLHPSLAKRSLDSIEDRLSVINGLVLTPDTPASVLNSVDAQRGVRLHRDVVMQLDELREREHTGWGLQRISDFQPIPPELRSSARNSGFVYVYDDKAAGKGVEVYVIDSGIMCEHIDFEGRAECPNEGDMTEKDPKKQSNQPIEGHGTAIASVIGGVNFGVAPDANLISVKVLDKDNTIQGKTVIAGIGWVLDNVDPRWRALINYSGGIVPNPDHVYQENEPIDQAVQAALAKDVPFITATYNEPLNACVRPPAKVEGVIIVSSSDVNDKFDQSAGRGSCVTLIAPGVDIVSASFDPAHPEIVDLCQSTHGTSLATAFVSGAVAVYASMPSTKDKWKGSLIAAFLRNTAAKAVVQGIPRNIPERVGTTPNFLLQTTFSHWRHG